MSQSVFRISVVRSLCVLPLPFLVPSVKDKFLSTIHLRTLKGHRAVAELPTPLGMLIKHNLSGLSSESNCPGKRRCLPKHAQGAVHAPSDNPVIPRASHGRKQAVQARVTMYMTRVPVNLQAV